MYNLNPVNVWSKSTLKKHCFYDCFIMKNFTFKNPCVILYTSKSINSRVSIKHKNCIDNLTLFFPNADKSASEQQIKSIICFLIEYKKIPIIISSDPDYENKSTAIGLIACRIKNSEDDWIRLLDYSIDSLLFNSLTLELNTTPGYDEDVD